MKFGAALDSSRAVTLLSAAYSFLRSISNRDSPGDGVSIGSEVYQIVIDSLLYRCYRTLSTVAGGQRSRYDLDRTRWSSLRQVIAGSVLVGLFVALLVGLKQVSEQSQMANWMSSGSSGPTVEDPTLTGLERFLRRASFVTLAASVSHLSLLVLLRDGDDTLVAVNVVLVVIAAVGSLAPFSVSESSTYRLAVAVFRTAGRRRDD